MPALFTSTSTLPKWAYAVSTSVPSCPQSPTWQARGSARRPSASTSRAVASQASSLRLAITMSAPARAKASTISRPRPRLPPVTRATLPVRSKCRFIVSPSPSPAPACKPFLEHRCNGEQSAHPSVDSTGLPIVALAHAHQEVPREAHHLGARLPRRHDERLGRPSPRARLPRPPRRQALLRLGRRRTKGPQPEGQPTRRRDRRPLLRRLVQSEGRARPGHDAIRRQGATVPEAAQVALREVPTIPRR